MSREPDDYLAGGKKSGQKIFKQFETSNLQTPKTFGLFNDL